MTVTSPPYNIGKVYERRQKLAEYLAAYQEFARLIFAKTADTGSLCWQVGNYVEDGEVYPLDVYFYDIFKDAGFRLRNRIIWHYGHGLHSSQRLSARYQTILWFSKGDTYTFNLDPIRIPSKYPGKRAYKGENKGQPSGNPLGKNPSDFWPAVVRDWEASIWDVPNVKASHAERTGHPAQFPVEIAERCILALSNAGDLILDPFLGVGSTAIAAKLHQRRFTGFEIDAKYIAVAKERLALLDAGTLPLRPLGRSIYEPSPTDRVAQVPDEWLGNVDQRAAAAAD